MFRHSFEPDAFQSSEVPTQHCGDRQLRWSYRLFFVGVVLTGFGSGWFHWQPNNQTLIADRLPMAIAFMALTSALVGESFHATLGRRLLWPLQLLGVASVLWWGYSEHLGRGDLRLYVLVQFVPMLILPVIIWRRRSRSLQSAAGSVGMR